MGTEKIIILLNDSKNEQSKFSKKAMVYHRETNSEKQYSNDNSIMFETKTIKSSFYYYSDAYVFVTDNITVNAGDDTDVAIKNYARFSTWNT